MRCALHAHTTNSDGVASPAELVAHYAAAGVDVLAVTDHWAITPWVGEELVVIRSAELSAWVGAEGNHADVLAYGIPELPERREHFETVEAAARWIAGRGGVPFLAHPTWSGLQVTDLLDAPTICGVEVFNGGCELESGTGTAGWFWDQALRHSRGVSAIATDDSHMPGHDSRLGYTMLRARSREPAAIIDALRGGCGYGTSGPRIDEVAVDGEDVIVACSPAAAVTLRSGVYEGGRVSADPAAASWRAEALARDGGGLIVRARLRGPERSAWGRIEVRDVAGGVAWTNVLTLARAPGGEQSYFAARPDGAG